MSDSETESTPDSEEEMETVEEITPTTGRLSKARSLSFIAGQFEAGDKIRRKSMEVNSGI